jgi:ABC-type transporter Mla subunit MlaD
MRRIVTALLLLAGLVAILSSGVAAGGDDGTYEVRAIFDNGAFLTKGEEVRIAGANVGTIADVDVTGNDEPAHEDGSPDPGKAVVVMRIEDPAFQDFRSDASCLIRPQSLLGEKFVECQPTQARSPGTEPPPALAKVPDGDPGAGQRFLPLESNGKTVDLDLVNNIQRLPYAERFRLILNDLGGALAGRGKDLAEVIDRSDPALRVTDEVLAKIASQNHRLAQLARDGDEVLTQLARDRQRITGFLANASQAAAATAEHKPALEAGFQKLPGFLRELRLTMVQLKGFADQAQPTFADLGAAAPAATKATEALGPFSKAGIPALRSLGRATAKANGPLTASDPVIRQLRNLTKKAKPGTKNLKKLLRSIRKTNGFQYIDSLFFNGTGVTNLYDNYGHILRTILPNNNCVDYVTSPVLGCSSNFGQPGSASGRMSNSRLEQLLRQRTLAVLGPQADAAAADAAAADAAQNPSAKSSTGGKTPGLDGVKGLLDYVYGNDAGPKSNPGSSATPSDGETASVGPRGGVK